MNMKNENYLNTIRILSILCTTIIIARLGYLQIYLGHQYGTQSIKNYVRYEQINSARGEILDCNGNKLVTNKPIINLYWHGTGNRRLTEQQQNLITQLSRRCHTFICNQEIIQKITLAEKRNEQLLLMPNISFELLSRIEEFFADEINITIKHDFKRFYPHADLASHIIGYLSNAQIEAMGKMGLEKKFQEILQGTDGTVIKTINSYGKRINMHELHKSTVGKNVQVTLDLAIQQLVEQVFDAQYIGTFIIMDPQTGAIKALCSRPNFDPTLFLDPLHPEKWRSMQKNNPFLNRAIQCAYPPGSLFKLITISAALQNDLIHPEDSFTCKGFTTFGKRRYSCNQKQGHGTLTIKQAVALSCNPLFYELGKKLSIDTLADYAQRFGLGTKTGIIFPENNGLIPTAAWKQEVYGERWWPGETLSAAIGQSYLLTTPMQIARMIGSIFTGFLVKPRILFDEPIETTTLEINPETTAFLQDSMRSVVTEGTGHRVNKIKDITIHAKTSTAQMSDMKKRTLGKKYLEHGWVVAHFKYKDYEPLVIVAMVEHAGSSRVPMIIAKNFLLGYRDLQV
ncbi:MAG: penicillin-binding transpeptidase domain-containing protein [Candidatus Dependentiae bacterium]